VNIKVVSHFFVINLHILNEIIILAWKEKSKSDRKKNYKQKKESEMRKRIVIGQERFIFWQANLKMSDAMFKVNCRYYFVSINYQNSYR
jgi:hypothetical protein